MSYCDGFVVKTPSEDFFFCQTRSDAARAIIRYVVVAEDELALRDVQVFDFALRRTRAAVELLAAGDLLSC